MMEIISPPTEVTKAFNSIPLRFKMHETNPEDTHSPSPSPPGLESAREEPMPTSDSPNYPKASSASTIPYPSPPVLPPLDLSSVPTSPEKEVDRTTTVVVTQPGSVEIHPTGSPLDTASEPAGQQVSSRSALSPDPAGHRSKVTTLSESREESSASEEAHLNTMSRPSMSDTAPSCSEASEPPVIADSQMADWTQMLQNFAAFCQGKVKLLDQVDQDTTSEGSNKKNRTDGDLDVASKPDALSQLQAMFFSMSQMLSNSQSNSVPPPLGSPAKSGEERSETKDKVPCSSTSMTQPDPLSYAAPTNPIGELNNPASSSSSSSSSPLSSSAVGLTRSTFTATMPMPCISTFASTPTVPASSDFPMAFTASLLAMFAAQSANANSGKSINLSQAANELNPFGAATNSLLLPNSFVSGSATSHTSSQGNTVHTGPFPTARVPPIFPNTPTNSCAIPGFFPPPIPSNKFSGLPDNRELLYQLGQQLIVMAAASGTPSELGTKPTVGPWPPTNNSNSTATNSNINPSMDTHSLSGFSPSHAPFLSGPMAAMLGSSLFGPQPFPLPNAPGGGPVSNQPVQATVPQSIAVSSSAAERKPTGLIPNPVLDKTLHPGCLPGAGSSLSGISMRGNQKYSAYYQHQRKQGFHQLNTNTMDYPGAVSSARRQGTPLTTPMSGSRYASRRFRGSLNPPGLPTHSMGLEARGVTGSSTVPGGPRLPSGVRAPTATMFPGFRGTGPYGSTSGSVSVQSANPLATTSNSAAISKHTLHNGTAAVKLHSTTDPMQLAATASCVTTPSVGSMNTTGPSETPTTRHRDTAFLCSCGQDFESLYVFTLHMKDTGHKPKSDQSERDIPKLVRGQDMWINSETEQTREILRCMRCHQSFRSLPELTMHMMKTNHYSEIVYNDSGRLVFVNPDDPHHPHSRRGSGNPSTGSSGASPGKSAAIGSSPGHWLGRRGSRGSSVANASTTSLSTLSVSQGIQEHTGFKSQSPRSTESSVIQMKADPSGTSTESIPESHDSNSTKELDLANEIDRPGSTERGRKQGSDSVQRATLTESQIPTELSSHTPGSDSMHALVATDRDSPMSSSSNKPEAIDCTERTDCCSISPQSQTSKETNVLRQIESFVENNLPRTPKGISVKVDHGSSCASHQSTSSPLATPSTDASSRYSYGLIGAMNSTSDSSKSSPLGNRKRTHSEASLSTHGSPIPSPTSEHEKRGKHTSTNEVGGKITTSSSAMATMPLTPTSPGVTSTTSEFNSPLRENPLSSLQKLVETTHKPVPPSAAFATPTGASGAAACCFSSTSCTPTSLFVSCNGSGFKGSAHSTSTVNSSNRLGNTGGSSSGPSSGPRSLGSPMDVTAGSPFGLNTNVGSHSPGSQFAPIMLPASESENLIPALSALYAYVEKTSSVSSAMPISSAAMPSTTVHQASQQQQSSHQSHDPSQLVSGTKTDCLSPSSTEQSINTGSINPSMEKLTSNPAIQAIYAAAMSSLAAQYLATQPGSTKSTPSADPLEAFKQAASNFQSMLGDVKTDSTDSSWLKMLQLFTGKPFQFDSNQTPENESTESARQAGALDDEVGLGESAGRTTQNPDGAGSDRTQCQTPAQSQSNTSPGTAKNTGNCSDKNSNNNQSSSSGSSERRSTGETNVDSVAGNSAAGDGGASAATAGVGNDRISVRTPDSNKGTDTTNTAQNSPSPSKMTSSIDACSYASMNHMNARAVYSNSPNSYHPHLPGMLSGRYPSIQGRSIQTNTQSPALMTTMITKKAKCHFCGKPFANKGQVRLHISKNKCPCLLQQSCHVAALAAAFGTDNRPLTSTNPAPSKSYIKDPLLGTKARNSAEEFLASLTYPTAGANTLPGDSNDSAPSALSLLKERFQNFDLSQSPLRTGVNVSNSGGPSTEPKTSCPPYTNPAKSSESDPLFAAAASYASSFGQTLQSQSLLGPGIDGNSIAPVSWPFGAPPGLPSPFTSSSGTLATPTSGGSMPNVTGSAAANASHLAAMALLAQTLVQLTSSQTTQSSSFRSNVGGAAGAVPPAVSTCPSSFSDPAMTAAAAAAAAAAAVAAQVSNRSLSTPTSSSTPGAQNPANSLSPSSFVNPATAFNLDLFMNQTAFMKQLAAMANWPDPGPSGHRSEEDLSHMTNPFLALSNSRNTAPNGLP